MWKGMIMCLQISTKLLESDRVNTGTFIYVKLDQPDLFYSKVHFIYLFIIVAYEQHGC